MALAEEVAELGVVVDVECCLGCRLLWHDTASQQQQHPDTAQQAAAAVAELSE